MIKWYTKILKSVLNCLVATLVKTRVVSIQVYLRNMKSFEKFNYHKALVNYYHKTKEHIVPTISHKVNRDIETIDEYEKRNVSLSKTDLIIRFCLNLIGQVIGTAIYSVLIIYTLNEIFSLSVSYTAMNIFLFTLILLGPKVKFRLAEEN